MCRDVFGITGLISNAPVKYRLRKYGGDMGIDEFRSQSFYVRNVLHDCGMITSGMINESVPISSGPLPPVQVDLMSGQGSLSWDINNLTIPKPVKAPPADVVETAEVAAKRPKLRHDGPLSKWRKT